MKKKMNKKMNKKHDRLHDFFKREKIIPEMYLVEWVITLYTTVTPLSLITKNEHKNEQKMNKKNEQKMMTNKNMNIPFPDSSAFSHTGSLVFLHTLLSRRVVPHLIFK